MCGIWAVFGPGYRTFSPQKYLPGIAGRGPEGAHVADVSGVGYLGFTRLAINGLNASGMQPMTNADRSVIWMANGEIYNWRELAAAHGIPCPSGSDCEVIGGLYERFADEPQQLFRALDGVFAAVIVDLRRGKILVARDPYGVRPAYIGRADGHTWISSELKAMPCGELTSVEHVRPGHFYTLDASTGTFVSQKAFHHNPIVKLPALSDVETACRSIRVALEAAVRKRMMTERPVAALLSGGVDSSLIASLVAKELRAAGAPPLRTFSIGMEGSSDLAHARRVAAWIGSDHTEVVVTADAMFEAIPAVIHDIETYDTTSVRASVGNWLVAREVARRCDSKVVFNGDGSDEVFGSYLYFLNAPSDTAYEREVERLLDEIHMFDVLRSDRSISSHGLEPRTPFLDKAFVAAVLSVPVGLRRPSAGLPEKWLLRRAFDDGVTLPREVLWRRKEAFSDGVSGERSWYEICKEKAAAAVPLNWATAAPLEYRHLTPTTAEMYLYRQLYSGFYGSLSEVNVPHFWMPRWCEGATDPSARTLAVYT